MQKRRYDSITWKRPSLSSGLMYIYQSGSRGKKFYRKTLNSTLKSYKSKLGFKCYGHDIYIGVNTKCAHVKHERVFIHGKDPQEVFGKEELPGRSPGKVLLE